MHKQNNFEAIQPVGEHFRTLSPEAAFTWEQGIFQTDPEGLYVVAFKSIRNLAAGRAKIDRLLELDNDAFEEAQKAPGFGTYWHDDEVPQGVGLSFCLWQKREDARAAAALPAHRAAVEYVRSEEGHDVYLEYSVSGRTVHKTPSGLEFLPLRLI